MAGRKPKNPEDRKRYTGKNISGFCQKVRERRIQLGVTQAELAARTGYGQVQISKLEGGAFPTSEERILALCSALETTPDYLFGFREERDTTNEH